MYNWPEAGGELILSSRLTHCSPYCAALHILADNGGAITCREWYSPVLHTSRRTTQCGTELDMVDIFGTIEFGAVRV